MKRSRTTFSQPDERTRSEADRWQSLSSRFLSPLWFALATFVVLAIVSGPVFAEVKLRVEARPVTEPINVFVTVTNGGGNPVGGLDDTDFTVLVDGVEVVSPTFSLSPNQDPDKQASVVFAMDYSSSTLSAQPAMEQAVLTFLDSMQIGDYAAIIKFNNTNTQRVAVLQPFTMIDNASGSSALEGAVRTPYSGSGSPVIDAIEVAVQQFVNRCEYHLLDGPKVVLLVSDGRDNVSEFELGKIVTDAIEEGISVFSVAIGAFSAPASGTETGGQLLREFAFQTGGQYYEAPDDQAIKEAYEAVSQLLQNEYLLTFPSAIDDCDEHTVEVRVTNQNPATSTFTRRTCGTVTPPPTGDVGGTPAPPPAGDVGGTPSTGGGGGGGAFGPLGLIAGLSLLALRRRLRAA
jgi:VWFA-related protein